MFPDHWFADLTQNEIAWLTTSTLLLIVVLVWFLRDSKDPYGDPYPPPPLWYRCRMAWRELLHHLVHLAFVAVFLIVAWGYFSCCFEIWKRLCRLIGARLWNHVAIPALLLACFVFFRCYFLLLETLEAEARRD